MRCLKHPVRSEPVLRLSEQMEMLSLDGLKELEELPCIRGYCTPGIHRILPRRRFRYSSRHRDRCLPE